MFRGEIGITPRESTKDFPRDVKPPQGAPNVVIIMPDDVGFSATEVFGGPIPTPAFERVANAGLKFNRFHTTAQCSPTRAALLTGRNHHTCGTGAIMEMGVGYPGYNTVLSRKLAGLGEILKYNGYNTAWFGKNHNVPDWQNSQAGPFDLWPTGLGFEYFYGFIGGDTSQWEPALYEGTKPIEPPHDVADYHFDVDLADKAIERLQMLHAVAPEKPFFFYYVPGTAHAPHHAPKEWIDKFKGKFDQGWDKLREETFAAAEKNGRYSARCPAHQTTRRDRSLGLTGPGTEESVRSADGGFRRGAGALRPPDQPLSRRVGRNRADGQHHCYLHHGRQRRQW